MELVTDFPCIDVYNPVTHDIELYIFFARNLSSKLCRAKYGAYGKNAVWVYVVKKVRLFLKHLNKSNHPKQFQHDGEPTRLQPGPPQRPDGRRDAGLHLRPRRREVREGGRVRAAQDQVLRPQREPPPLYRRLLKSLLDPFNIKRNTQSGNARLKETVSDVRFCRCHYRHWLNETTFLCH